jgi:hypothetical protein
LHAEGSAAARSGRGLLGASLLFGAALLAAAALSGCGRKTGDIAPLRLRHTPPVAELSAEQLRSLSMECDSYSPHEGMRGRYDAAYCDEAMAAWADAPLQMVTVKPKP